MLVGRDPELARIDLLLERGRAGDSATLALIGEPGIGKTALLDYAAQRADGMQLLRARGVESEAQIPFASLLELIRPALGMLDSLPSPQAAALEAALALRPSGAQQRFAVGAATLSLLAAYADRQPVAVVIDDAQWLDPPSAQAVLFAVRRLVADRIATLIAVREGEPSLLDGTDLPRAHLGGLSHKAAGMLLDGVPPEHVTQLHAATAGNPLALLELAPDADQLALVPEGAPVLVSTRIVDAFIRRTAGLDEQARSALVLAATSDRGDLATLGRAAAPLGIDVTALIRAESAGLVRLSVGVVEFRHPLARSAIYGQATSEERRAAHRALAAALPDRDYDRRAWHLASAAVGADEAASAALEQAADRARGRSAYATATAGYERAAMLADDALRRSRLLLAAAQTGWFAGLGDRAQALLEQAREGTTDGSISIEADRLAGHIAARRGPVMECHRILTAAAERADPERAVEMLVEAAAACFVAGEPAEMLAVAQRARALVPDYASDRTRFLAATSLGMAHIIGGDGGVGAASIHDAVELAESSTELGEDLELLPWFALTANFARETTTGRSLLERVLGTARANSAIGGLPFLLTLIARHHAGAHNWAVAEAYYREGIELARETDQQTDLTFALAGIAWLQARRGQAQQCQSAATEALSLCERLGTHLLEIWSCAALGELDLGSGATLAAIEHFDRQSRVMDDLGIVDPDLSPAPELVDAYVRLGRREEAERILTPFLAAATAKAQPWSVARARRAEGLLADNGAAAELFEQALIAHAQTPDVFEQARTQLAYGERLRRSRDRIGAREQLRAAVATFDQLGAAPWAERARIELAATGETLRRRDPTTVDELTPQELQISLLLAGGKTTREAAAALFLSPKTIEYHLRHVYLKLDVHSRDALALALAKQAG